MPDAVYRVPNKDILPGLGCRENPVKTDAYVKSWRKERRSWDAGNAALAGIHVAENNISPDLRNRKAHIQL